MDTPYWLTWHDHSRSRNLSRVFGARLLVYDHRMSGALRHWEGFWWTVGRLVRHRPRVIYLQNSFLLLLACALYRLASGGRVRSIVADCHNKSLRRRLHGPLASVFGRLKRFSFRAVDLVIVSNRYLVPDAERLCPHVATLIDPLPVIADPERGPHDVPAARDFVLFVCSHEPDEPIPVVVDVARRIVSETGWDVVVTGEVPSDSPLRGVASDDRVSLPGFVAWTDYCWLLRRAGAVVVLTEDRDCLCCGAYEAVSCGRPLVLSGHPMMREVFTGCAEFASAEAAGVYDAVLRSLGSGSSPSDPGRSGDDLRRRFEEELAGVTARLAAVVSESTLP